MALTRMHLRYGGVYQSQPLSPAQQVYDDTCREIDELEHKIGAKSLALFTAEEFIRFSHFVEKVFFAPRQVQLDQQKGDLLTLLDELERREKNNGR